MSFLDPKRGPWWRKTLVQFTRLGLIYGAYLLLLVSCETKMLFPAQDRPVSFDREKMGDWGASKMFTTSNGATGEGLLVRREPDGQAAPLLIIAHGNGELIDDHLEEARAFARRGVDVLLIEYPGYGIGTGKPSTAGIREVSLKAYDWAVDEMLTPPPSKVVGCGFSLGTGIVCHLGLRRDVDGLVLYAPFSELHFLATKVGAPSFVMVNRFDNMSALNGFKSPVRIVHGSADGVISPSYSEDLSAELEDCERHLIDGVAHNDLYYSPEAMEITSKWLKEMLGR